MDIQPLVKGLVVGFSIAVPVGPMGMLCIHRTLERGRWAGFLTGLGIATADAFYASVAAFGLTFLLRLAVTLQGWAQAAGGLFLLYLGVKVVLAKPLLGKKRVEKRQSLLAVFGTTFLLTLSNPPTLFSFMALFATLGEAGRVGGVVVPILLVAGVFAGSAFWWLLLSQGVNLLRRKMRPQWWVWINRTSGAVIAGFGLFAFFNFLKGWL